MPSPRFERTEENVGVRKAEQVGTNPLPNRTSRTTTGSGMRVDTRTRHKRRERTRDNDGEKGLAVDADHAGGDPRGQCPSCS